MKLHNNFRFGSVFVNYPNKAPVTGNHTILSKIFVLSETGAKQQM